LFLRKINQYNKLSRINDKEISIGKDNYGSYIIMDGIMIAIDSWNPKADIIFISHAHMDHIPIIPDKELQRLENEHKAIYFMCSKITKEIVELRTKKKFNFPESIWLLGKEMDRVNSIEYGGVRLSLIYNGHTYGSTSLYIEGFETILYTSDFILNDCKFLNGRKTIKGLNPIKCDHLIMECTFGAPKYIFPSFIEIQMDLNEYIKTQLSKGVSVILLGYSFGKS